MQLDCSGVCVCLWTIAAWCSRRMHITAMQLQRSQKEEKVIARQEEIRWGVVGGCLPGLFG